MYRCIVIAVFCLSVTAISWAQTPAFAQDLDQSRKISVNSVYTFPTSPVGYGKQQEFPVNYQRSAHFFENERNTAWFLIDIPADGTFTFEIKPHRTEDDYDWMLFEYTALLKEQINSNTAKLLRSNNSRNDRKVESRTGLKTGFENLFEVPGPGKSFSRPLVVKSGQKLALIIDNIYPGGHGFDLQTSLHYDSKGRLQGTVKDSITGQPLKASVTVEAGAENQFIARVSTDESGKYSLDIPQHVSLYITAESRGYLFKPAINEFSETPAVQDFLLTRPAAGAKLVLYQIHFSPNQDKILDSSEAEINRLIQFLKEFPSWDIKIAGHTNHNVFASTRYLQRLSFSRALAVKQILLQHGIAERRISCTGLGGKYPIADTKDPIESLKNLRVEIILQNESK